MNALQLRNDQHDRKRVVFPTVPTTCLLGTPGAIFSNLSIYLIVLYLSNPRLPLLVGQMPRCGGGTRCAGGRSSLFSIESSWLARSNLRLVTTKSGRCSGSCRVLVGVAHSFASGGRVCAFSLFITWCTRSIRHLSAELSLKYTYLFILPIRLSTDLCIDLIYSPNNQPIYLGICLSTFLTFRPSIHASFYLSIHRISLYLSVYLSTFQICGSEQVLCVYPSLFRLTHLSI